jgi:large subunit ribosomal protein L17
MRHKKQKVTFGRKTGPRKALLRSLCINMINDGAIKTTHSKAKAVRSMIEPLITMGKDASIHDMRNIEATLGSKKATQKLVKEISPRFAKRDGGYTSLVKMGPRKGDNAEVAQLRFVD